MKSLLMHIVLATALCGSIVCADEVTLKNGDHLIGKVTATGSKLTIESKATGKITVDLKDVQSFRFDKPGTVDLKNGSTVNGQVTEGPSGGVLVTPPAGAPFEVPASELEAINRPLSQWTGDFLAGGLLARGNTDADSFNASADLTHTTRQDEFTFHGQYLFGRQRVPGDGKHETVDDLLGRLKYQYNFTPRWYGYAEVEAEHDVIAGLDLRLAPTVGGGFKWIDEPNLSFNTEAGVGYLYRQYAHDGSTGSAIARIAYHAKAKFNDKVSLVHNLQYLPGLDRIDNYFLSTDIGIRADMTAKFYTEFKIEYQYDSKPAPGHGPNDVRYILGVGVAF